MNANPTPDLDQALYDSLRQLAGQRIAREGPANSLSPTDLVHEVWLRVRNDRSADWTKPETFFPVAAQAMRRLLIDRARSRQSQQRGGDRERIDIHELDFAGPTAEPVDILAFDDALQALKRDTPRSAEVAHLRAYAGLHVQEIANVLRLSRKTIYRDLEYADTFLNAVLKGRINGDVTPR